MERYQVADNPDGPWLELTVCDTPQKALTRARGAFDWKVVWVAKMAMRKARSDKASRRKYWEKARPRDPTWVNLDLDALWLMGNPWNGLH